MVTPNELPEVDELDLMHNTVCRAVGDPKRILILYLLSTGPHCVGDIAEKLGWPQPTVSRHLALLRQQALVETERDGVSIIYSLADHRIIDVLDMMRTIMRDALGRQSRILD